MKCKICLSDGPFKKIHKSTCMFNGSNIIRYECPNCNVIFGPINMINMSSVELGKQYSQLYKNYKESDATIREVNLLNYLKPNNKKKYLNWGAGNNSKTIVKSNSNGINLKGYDPYAVVMEDNFICKEQDLEIYDGIMSCNFIEHLQDPVSGFIKMSTHLKDDGMMVHGTPCYQYKYINTRFHLYFFLGKSVNIMSERVGLIAERTKENDVFLYYKR